MHHLLQRMPLIPFRLPVPPLLLLLAFLAWPSDSHEARHFRHDGCNDRVKALTARPLTMAGASVALVLQLRTLVVTRIRSRVRFGPPPPLLLVMLPLLDRVVLLLQPSLEPLRLLH